MFNLDGSLHLNFKLCDKTGKLNDKTLQKACIKACSQYLSCISALTQIFCLLILDEETQTFSGDISMITQTDWYNLLLKACQALKLLQRYQDMVDITQSAVNNEKLRDFHDRKELVVSDSRQ